MKYKAGVKKRLEDAENSDIQIDDNAELGKSKLEVQIATLSGKIIEAKAEVRIKKKEYEDSKFAMPFDLKKIDDAEYAFNIAKNAQKSLEADKKSREALLKELF